MVGTSTQWRVLLIVLGVSVFLLFSIGLVRLLCCKKKSKKEGRTPSESFRGVGINQGS